MWHFSLAALFFVHLKIAIQHSTPPTSDKGPFPAPRPLWDAALPLFRILEKRARMPYIQFYCQNDNLVLCPSGTPRQGPIPAPGTPFPFADHVPCMFRSRPDTARIGSSAFFASMPLGVSDSNFTKPFARLCPMNKYSLLDKTFV